MRLSSLFVVTIRISVFFISDEEEDKVGHP